ncbi:MAG: tetratricopeptide repeat protein [Candidatus Hydrogenedentales bacterium]
MAFGGENAESYYDEGLTASMKGDLDAAVKLFEKAIRLDHTMAAAYHQLGKCFMRMGRGQRAVELLEQVVQKRPQLVPARLDLGFAFLELGRLDQARHQFDQVLALKPAESKAQLGLAQAAFYEGNWEGAMQQVQTALVHGSNSFPIQFLLGRAAKLAGNAPLADSSLKKADRILEKTIEVDPEKPEPHFLRGEVRFVQEQYTAALDHYRSAVEKSQPNRMYTAFGENFTLADMLAKQGLCLQRLGQHDRARAMGERVAEVDPNHPIGKTLRESSDE